jgi:hypothetical protein
MLIHLQEENAIEVLVVVFAVKEQRFDIKVNKGQDLSGWPFTGGVAESL